MKIQRRHVPSVSRPSTVVGVFDDNHLAGQAVCELSSARFAENDIRVVLRRRGGSNKTASAEQHSDCVTGALTASVSSEMCADVGVLAAAIPTLGLPVARADAAVGAGVPGLLVMLVGAGVPEPEARYYRDEFEAGRTIVAVTAGSRHQEARAILRRHGSYDMLSGILSCDGR